MSVKSCTQAEYKGLGRVAGRGPTSQLLANNGIKMQLI